MNSTRGVESYCCLHRNPIPAAVSEVPSNSLGGITMNSVSLWTRCSVALVAAVLFIAFAAPTSAQVQTQTTTTSGTPTKEAKI